MLNVIYLEGDRGISFIIKARIDYDTYYLNTFHGTTVLFVTYLRRSPVGVGRSHRRQDNGRSLRQGPRGSRSTATEEERDRANDERRLQ